MWSTHNFHYYTMLKKSKRGAEVKGGFKETRCWHAASLLHSTKKSKTEKYVFVVKKKTNLLNVRPDFELHKNRKQRQNRKCVDIQWWQRLRFEPCMDVGRFYMLYQNSLLHFGYTPHIYRFCQQSINLISSATVSSEREKYSQQDRKKPQETRRYSCSVFYSSPASETEWLFIHHLPMWGQKLLTLLNTLPH